MIIAFSWSSFSIGDGHLFWLLWGDFLSIYS
jgi:hypothetical protein